jgi:hypothetical protein
MPALELLCHFIGIDPAKFTKEENLFLEAELYSRVSHEIEKAYQSQYKEYFHLLNLNVEWEDTMMELNFIRSLIGDILQSEAYTLSGIAYYTQTPEEVIEDLFIGYKMSPLIGLPRKLIELHKSIKPEIYQNIIKKMLPPIDGNPGV